MGHMGYGAKRVNGVQGYGAHGQSMGGHKHQWVQGYGGQGVWVTWAMFTQGTMGYRGYMVHGQWGTWVMPAQGAMGYRGQKGIEGIGHMGYGAQGPMGYRGMGQMDYGCTGGNVVQGVWETGGIGYRSWGGLSNVSESEKMSSCQKDVKCQQFKHLDYGGGSQKNKLTQWGSHILT